MIHVLKIILITDVMIDGIFTVELINITPAVSSLNWFLMTSNEPTLVCMNVIFDHYTFQNVLSVTAAYSPQNKHADFFRLILT